MLKKRSFQRKNWKTILATCLVTCVALLTGAIAVYANTASASFNETKFKGYVTATGSDGGKATATSTWSNSIYKLETAGGFFQEGSSEVTFTPSTRGILKFNCSVTLSKRAATATVNGTTYSNKGSTFSHDVETAIGKNAVTVSAKATEAGREANVTISNITFIAYHQTTFVASTDIAPYTYAINNGTAMTPASQTTLDPMIGETVTADNIDWNTATSYTLAIDLTTIQDGYQFNGWQVSTDGGTTWTTISTEASCTYTPHNDVVIQPNIVEQKVTTKFVYQTSGKFWVDEVEITADTERSESDSYEYKLKATPATGYFLTGWYVSSKASTTGAFIYIDATQGEATYTLTGIEQVGEVYPIFAPAITVNFAAPPAGSTYKISAMVGSANSYPETTISSATSVTVPEGSTFALTAVPGSGKQFSLWTKDGESLSNAASCTKVLQDGDTIAMLTVPNVGIFQVGETAGNNYPTWELAMQAAKAQGHSKVILIAADVQLPGDMAGNGLTEAGGTYVKKNGDKVQYLLPTGITFLMPYISTDIYVGVETKSSSESLITGAKTAATYCDGNVTFITDYHDDSSNSKYNIPGRALNPQDGVNFKLTVPETAEITIQNGSRFVIGGTIASGHWLTRGMCGGTSGDHANVQLDGKITVENGGVLSCCGYILGDGKVDVASGGIVRQPFVIMNHFAGVYVLAGYNKNQFPIGRYAVLNIQSDMDIAHGGKMYGYIALYTSETTVGAISIPEQFNTAEIQLVGTMNDTDCVLLLQDNARLEISYDENTYVLDSGCTCGLDNLYDHVGRTTLHFFGGAAFGKLDVSVTVAVMTYTASSETSVFPVPYNYNIILDGYGSTYAIDQSVVLMPGATMTVAQNVTLSIGGSGESFVVLDGVRDHFGVADSVDTSKWYALHYPSTSSLQSAPFYGNGTANFIVNGTLTVGESTSFGGVIQTEGSGKVTLNGPLSANAQVGISTASESIEIAGQGVHSLNAQLAGQTNYTVTARLATKNGIEEIVQGKTYTAIDDDVNILDTFGYTVYAHKSSATDPTNYADYIKTMTGVSLNANVIGLWCMDHDPAGTNCACKRFSFYAANVRLGNNLDMLFAFPKANITNPTGYYVRAVRTYADGSSEVIIFKYGATSAEITRTKADGTTEKEYVYCGENTWKTSNNTYYYVTYTGFAAKQMCDTISLTVHQADGTVVSAVWVDSIQNYAMRMLAKAETDSRETLKILIVDMLNYGAACQEHFGYDTNNLANAMLTTTQQAYGTDKVATAPTDDEQDSRDKKYWYGDNLVADSNSQFVVGFTGEFKSGMYFTYEFKNHWGNEIVKEITYDNMSSVAGRYHGLANLRVADARIDIVFKVYNSSGELESTWTDSIARYVARMSTDEDDVYMAFLKFADAAKAYLHSEEDRLT